MRFITVIFLFCSVTFANELTNFSTLNGNFTQNVTNSNNSTIKYSGEVYIKGNNILWKYKQPIEKNVFIKDSFVIVDEPEIEQAIFTSVSSELNLINMLNKAKKVSNLNYEVEFNNITYKIALKNDALNKIEYTDQMDNKIEILFESMKKDKGIEDKTFDFKPPEYYDIIRK